MYVSMRGPGTRARPGRSGRARDFLRGCRPGIVAVNAARWIGGDGRRRPSYRVYPWSDAGVDTKSGRCRGARRRRHGGTGVHTRPSGRSGELRGAPDGAGDPGRRRPQRRRGAASAVPACGNRRELQPPGPRARSTRQMRAAPRRLSSANGLHLPAVAASACKRRAASSRRSAPSCSTTPFTSCMRSSSMAARAAHGSLRTGGWARSPCS